MALFVCEHPLSRHLLTQLRDKTTSPERFRRVSRLLSNLLLLEATKDLKLKEIEISTPLETMYDATLAEGLAVVPVLRAGLSMLESALTLFPDVAVGYVGLERNEETAVAHSYYCKLPSLPGRLTLCLDPMLATGGSASQAIDVLKKNGADRIKMVSVISAPEGVARLQSDHPDVPIFTAAVDRELSPERYIMPGLGDFGDRLYGTM